jgi:hypothetical protein
VQTNLLSVRIRFHLKISGTRFNINFSQVVFVSSVLPRFSVRLHNEIIEKKIHTVVCKNTFEEVINF